MKKDSIYFKQADLLLEILPIIARERDFAIKGGTAINFFVRNLPRLSIDIDLCYLPVNSREIALNDIQQKLLALKKVIDDRFKKVMATNKYSEKKISGYVLNIEGLSIKIEVNPVIRGSVFQPEVRTIVQKAGDFFEKFVEAHILPLADLYGGKICAALDRQHPRDLFDVKLLLENEGITEEIKQAFIIYLLSHPRPLIELLNPGLKDLSEIFANEFEGMTLESISLDQLLAARERLIIEIHNSLSREDRRFIASFKNKKPDWQLFPLSHVRKLPAIQWKLLNLRRMEKKKHREALIKLLTFLEIDQKELI
jgi:predicted nucleotidyltransferase component of viral defense system